jgi:hypothetical protein
MRLVGDRLQGSVGELKRDIIKLEFTLVLLDQSIFGLGQYLDQGVCVELRQRADNRQTADEFRDQAIMDEVLGFEFVDRLDMTLLIGFDVGLEPQ